MSFLKYKYKYSKHLERLQYAKIFHFILTQHQLPAFQWSFSIKMHKLSAIVPYMAPERQADSAAFGKGASTGIQIWVNLLNFSEFACSSRDPMFSFVLLYSNVANISFITNMPDTMLSPGSGYKSHRLKLHRHQYCSWVKMKIFQDHQRSIKNAKQLS